MTDPRFTVYVIDRKKECNGIVEHERLAQKYAVDFIKEHSQSALLLECGCGKTVIADLLKAGEGGKVLVICPIRVAHVWSDEIQEWEHLHELKYSVAVGECLRENECA